MLSCDDYDYIEIACLYGFDVELHYANYTVRGIAKDTRRNDQSEEGMLVFIAHQQQTKWFPLNSLVGLTAHTKNHYFDKLEFSH